MWQPCPRASENVSSFTSVSVLKEKSCWNHDGVRGTVVSWAGVHPGEGLILGKESIYGRQGLFQR